MAYIKMIVRNLVSTAILFFSIGETDAQTFRIPVTTQMKTPYGNVPITTYNYVGMPMSYYRTTGPVSYKHKFFVILKNDSSFSCKTSIDFTEETHSITYKHGKKEITLKPSDTKTLSWMTQTGRQILGIAADSCWLFKVNADKINSYSFLAEENMLAIIAIQKGNDGPIVPLNKETLRAMVGDDPKTLKLIESNKLVKAIQRYNYKGTANVVPSAK